MMPAERQGSSSDSQRVEAGLVIAGKYKLLKVIGEGGMGAVWAATHLGLNQPVALKIISKTYANSEEARRRFDHEAKAAARLKSRYVVQVFDNGELPDGTPYMAMELLEGESLGQRLARGRISLTDAATYLSQIARALDRAHELGIIHRDIKPENIFLARSHDDESGIVVKVLDFGIAKIAPLDNGQSETRTGVLMGTPLFMSPEQARGLKTLDHRSDLYSIGMVVFTMLTGKKAFGGESLIDLVVQVCTFPLPTFADAGLDVPPSLDAWFQRACHREPSHRFSSGKELSDAFAIAATGRGVTPPTAAVSERSESAAGLSQSSELMRGLPDGATANTGPWPSPSPNSIQGAAHTRLDVLPRRSNTPLIGAIVAVVVIVGGGAMLFRERQGPEPIVGVTAAAPPDPLPTGTFPPYRPPTASAFLDNGAPASTPSAATVVAPPVVPSTTASVSVAERPSPPPSKDLPVDSKPPGARRPTPTGKARGSATSPPPSHDVEVGF